jgi:hypothetical protein
LRLIGDVKFSERYGASVHLSAALAIARRGMTLSERVPARPSVLLGSGVRVTLDPPARMDRRHVWKSWAVIAHGRKAALAGRIRSAKGRSSSARQKCSAGERSLAQDQLFLDQLIRMPGGATPPAKPSAELFGRRADEISSDF